MDQIGMKVSLALREKLFQKISATFFLKKEGFQKISATSIF